MVQIHTIVLAGTCRIVNLQHACLDEDLAGVGVVSSTVPEKQQIMVPIMET